MRSARFCSPAVQIPKLLRVISSGTSNTLTGLSATNFQTVDQRFVVFLFTSWIWLRSRVLEGHCRMPVGRLVTNQCVIWIDIPARLYGKPLKCYCQVDLNLRHNEHARIHIAPFSTMPVIFFHARQSQSHGMDHHHGVWRLDQCSVIGSFIIENFHAHVRRGTSTFNKQTHYNEVS